MVESVSLAWVEEGSLRKVSGDAGDRGVDILVAIDPGHTVKSVDLVVRLQ